MSDPRQDITNRILVHLEAGTPPWRKAWTSQSTRPINALSHRPYSGINNLLLGMAMMERPEFGLDNRFLTMKQGGKLKTRVRKGEKAAAFVVKMVEVERRNAKSEGVNKEEVVGEDADKFLVMRSYAVFHASQFDPPLPPMAQPTHKVESSAAVDALVEGLRPSGLKIVEGPFEPSFIPKLDTIRLPPMSAFKGADAADITANYFGTKLHELAHAVGAPKRLGRFGMSAPSLQERAYEELVAEWSAAMLCSDCGVKLGEDHEKQHSAYLASWAEALKADKSAIFRAAAAAQKTRDYLAERATPLPQVKEVESRSDAANDPVAPSHAAQRGRAPK